MAGSGPRLSETGRTEAFSDGVIAIALTLLVLDLIQEHEPGALAGDLLRDWPAYVAYLVAFLTIASIWISHHGVFTRIVLVDPAVLVLNLVLLLGVALIPWPTALLARALAERPGEGTLADQRAAIVVYVIVSLVVSFGYTALSAAIVRRADLFAADGADDRAWVRRNAWHSALAVPVVVVAGAAGMLVPLVALIVFLLVPLAFFIPALARTRLRST